MDADALSTFERRDWETTTDFEPVRFEVGGGLPVASFERRERVGVHIGDSTPTGT